MLAIPRKGILCYWTRSCIAQTAFSLPPRGAQAHPIDPEEVTYVRDPRSS